MLSARLFIHSADRPVQDAWPHLDADDAHAVPVPPDASVADQTRMLLDDARTARSVVFAHSLRAVPAVLAAESGQIAGLVLVEPALYDLVRGVSSAERHIAIVSDARALAAAGDLHGSWAMLRPLMFGGALDETRWDAESSVAERWATSEVPWGHGVRRRMLSGIPALVVTGGWNEEYEAIAAVLVSLGATYRVLSGASHRPQDLPGFAPIVADFEARLPG
ncbi:hypothetical protein [Microbacterium maritypicum]